MTLKERILEKARKYKGTIVFPEGDERRTIQAAEILLKEGIAEPILIGNAAAIEEAAAAAGADLQGITHIDPEKSGKKEAYASLLYDLRKKKGMTEEKAGQLVLDPMYFGVLMVKAGDADGLVSGAVHTTGDMLRPALQIIKTKPGMSVVSSAVILDFPNRAIGRDGLLLCADCVVVPCPTAEELAQIAVNTADTARTLFDNEDPKVALLSFSTKGSAEHELVTKVREAARIAHEIAPALTIDGELQFDAALVPEVGALKAPGSPVAGRAEVLIFPDLQSGNIGYKIAQRLGGAEAYSILQGLDRPCNDLSRGCSVEDIVMTAAMTVLQGKDRA